MIKHLDRPDPNEVRESITTKNIACSDLANVLIRVNRQVIVVQDSQLLAQLEAAIEMAEDGRKDWDTFIERLKNERRNLRGSASSGRTRKAPGTA